jgi:hypothetical protein
MTDGQDAVRPPGASLDAAGGDAGGEPERPGDPACLLRRVCPACGSVADEDPPTTCPQCHAELTSS